MIKWSRDRRDVYCSTNSTPEYAIEVARVNPFQFVPYFRLSKSGTWIKLSNLPFKRWNQAVLVCELDLQTWKCTDDD